MRLSGFKGTIIENLNRLEGRINPLLEKNHIPIELSKPMIFNPFLGYKKEERNIFDQKVQESIKELALIDGAFVISSEGIVEAAGMFLHAGSGKNTPMRGLGARHAAAAAISLHTDSVAVAISESTGAVRIFSGGKAVRTFKSYRPQGRAHKK